MESGNGCAMETSASTGGIAERIAALKSRVRAEPSDPSHRIALFQLYCVTGNWEGAYTQLKVAEGIDTQRVLFAQVYSKALACEAERGRVFRGEINPTILGEPEPWVGLLIQALRFGAKSRWDDARALQVQAFESAPSIQGIINGKMISWIADADSRFGPMLEGFVDGQYRWIPFPHIKELSFEPAHHLIDAVWASVRFTWQNGGATTGLIPVRYPGSEISGADATRLARETQWEQKAEEFYVGLGQRLFTTDGEDVPILELKELILEPDNPGGHTG